MYSPVALNLLHNSDDVGRPKNDGGWYMSPTVKAGSQFANPFPLKSHTLEESLRLYRELIERRASPDATTADVIALLPPDMRRLAEARHAGGVERGAVGRSVAHLNLGLVGPPFCAALRDLRGKKLGCFCEESSPCHAKVLAEFAEVIASNSGEDADGAEATHGLKRKRDA